MNLKRINPVLSFFIYPGLVLFSGILVYKNVLFSTGPAFQIVDIKDLFFPVYYFIRKAFIMGEFPFWDPYTMLGQACVVNIGVATLYPFLLGFLSMGFLGPLLPRHLELFIVVHMLLSGITMYCGARKLGLSRLGACVAGIVFQMAIINKEITFFWEIACGLPWVPLAISFGIVLLRSEESILSKNNYLPFLITIVSLSFIISTTHPSLLVCAFLTLGLSVIFYIISNIKQKKWLRAIVVFKKAVWIFITPLLLTAVIILSSSVVFMDSIRFKVPPLLSTRVFFLKYGHIWSLLFPTWLKDSQPFVYAGVITLLLAIYFCFTKKRNGVNEPCPYMQGGDESFLFIIFAIFWFYYSVQGSLLERGLRLLPIFSSMRVTIFGLVIYVYAVSILAGRGLERIVKSRDFRIGLNRNLVFPAFIIFMLISSMPSAISFLRGDFHIVYILPLVFGCVFILYVKFQYLIRSDLLKVIVYRSIPVILLLEIFISSPHFIYKSEHEEFFPYDHELNKLASDFPECFLSKDLYRNENLCIINNMGDYYFDRYGTYGFYCNGSQSARYYYLWSKSGEIKGPYEKPPVSLDSKLYDLAGAKYFYLPEHEWLFIDYKKSGQGEWVEAELFDEVLVSGISIYNTPKPTDRRILRATIVLNDMEKFLVNIPDEEGWHRFYFEPIALRTLKIIAEEVSPLGIGEGTVGVVLGEVELLDKEGNKIDVPVKNFNASSTMLVSNPSCIMDNRLSHIWESRCDVLASQTIPSETLEKVGKGCYINKNVLPRAFMVHDYKYAKDKPELFQELHNENFSPNKVILLEGKPINFDIPEGPYLDEIEITRYGLNEIEIETKNDKPGFLILTDIYAPGWRVFVNGKKDNLLVADGIFRGVFIDKGEHKILFKYTPPLLKLGSGISLATLILIVIMGCSYLRPSKAKGGVLI